MTNNVTSIEQDKAPRSGPEKRETILVEQRERVGLATRNCPKSLNASCPSARPSSITVRSGLGRGPDSIA